MEPNPGAEVLASDGRPPRLTPRAIRVAAAGVAIAVMIGAVVLVWRYVTAVPRSPVAFSTQGGFSSALDPDGGYTFAFPVQNVLRERVQIRGLTVHAPSDHVVSALMSTGADFDAPYAPSDTLPVATFAPAGGRVTAVIRVKLECTTTSHPTSVSVRYRTAGHAYRTQILQPPTVAAGEETFASLARMGCLPP